MGDVEAVFLDRDGVINEDIGYVIDPNDLRLIPGSANAIRRINERSIRVLVATNQAGVARGYFPESHVVRFNEALSRGLEKEGAHIDKFYYCPHHPTAGRGIYKTVCDCRKPMPGLLHQAAKDFSLDLKKCVIIGDKASDVGAGVSAGCRTILVMTGYGEQERISWKESFQPDLIARDLAHAVQILFET